MFRPMQTDQQHDEPVPIGKAARLLGVSVDTLRRWDEAGHIESTRTIGGQRRYAPSEIERVKRGDAPATASEEASA
jgi:excisionase family DNA binding protein